ncbi:MAG: glycosyltransferase family 1 protein [Sumerlaeia bacterium]
MDIIAPPPPPRPLRHVAIDARMIGHSGIGTAIRGLLSVWSRTPPPFDVTLAGPVGRIRACMPEGLRANAVPFRLGIYDPRGMVNARMPTDGAEVLLCPHYTAPLGTRVPMAVMVQDLIHITHPTRRGTALFMQAYLARLRRHARYIITPSRHTKVQLQTLYGFAPERVLTIPYGAGVATMRPEAEETAVALPDEAWAREGNILAVGIHKPHKNWAFLLRRLAALWKDGALEGRDLAAAGLDEAGREAIPALARELGIADRVHVVPRLTDGEIAELYRRARVLAFSSLAEGFGFPILEAMRVGTPVVCAGLAPMSELAGGAALLFDPDAPESFDRALVEACEDAGTRERLMEAGFAQAGRYSWGRAARQVEDVMRRTFEERGRALGEVLAV